MSDTRTRMSVEVVKELWASGFVNRWHSNPDPRLRNSGDTTAAHSQRVATLVALLTAAKLDDVLAALWHDAPEVFVGDAPGPAKRAFPNLQAALDHADEVWWKALGWERAPRTDGIVALCDKLDAYLFVRDVAPDRIFSGEWTSARHWLEARADTLGVGDVVRGLVA